MIPGVIMDLATHILLLLCGYLSFKALESEATEDDTKWLTFWFVYSIFSLVESICSYVSFIIPFYGEIMFGVLVFLAFCGGAKMAYSMLLRPLLLKYGKEIDNRLSRVPGMDIDPIDDIKA